MRIINQIWMRPAYPGDEEALERREVAARLPGAGTNIDWTAVLVKQFRSSPRVWVAQAPSGEIVGFSAAEPCGEGITKFTYFCLPRRLAALVEPFAQCSLSSLAREGFMSASAGDVRWPKLADYAAAERARICREFAAPIELPSDTLTLDLRNGRDARNEPGSYSIGKYNEKRVGMYATPLFAGERDNHLGLDIGGPVGTPIRSFADGEIHSFGYNSARGDYGYVLITRHFVGGREIFALFGHLQKRSVKGKRVQQMIKRGETIAWIGDENENGGWDHPHLHFQLAWMDPGTHDMPGAAADPTLGAALRAYPDPRLVVGDLY